jgi:hypothetical protein
MWKIQLPMKLLVNKKIKNPIEIWDFIEIYTYNE